MSNYSGRWIKDGEDKREMKKAIEEELRRMLAKRYEYLVSLMLIEKDYEQLCELRKQAKTKKGVEKIDILLKELRIMRQGAGEEIEKLKDLIVSQVSEAELEEE